MFRFLSFWVAFLVPGPQFRAATPKIPTLKKLLLSSRMLKHNVAHSFIALARVSAPV
jgi:hypothetical protein